MPEVFGSLTNGRISADKSLAMIASWYDVHHIDIAAAAGDIIVGTVFPGEIVTGIGNADPAALVTAIVQTEANFKAGLTTPVTLTIAAGTQVGRVAPIYKIYKSGSSDNLVLYSHKR